MTVSHLRAFEISGRRKKKGKLGISWKKVLESRSSINKKREGEGLGRMPNGKGHGLLKHQKKTNQSGILSSWKRK